MEPATGEHGNSSHVEQGSSEDVIKIEHAMTLEAGNEISIACDSKVKVEHLTSHQCRSVCASSPCCNSSKIAPYWLVFATSPIKLIAGATPMRISPAKPLDSGFARGWRKLPDELRIEILKTELVFDRKVSDGCDALTNLRHYLALGPEISRLALQVFYGFNDIHLYLRDMVLPPVSARPHIRRLSLRLFRPYDKYWPCLQKISDPGSGLRGLRYVEIEVEVSDDYDSPDPSRRDLKISGPSVHFSCNGKVKVRDCYYTEDYKHIRREFERKVRELITFVE